MIYPDDLKGWPFAQQSRQIACAPHRWHVQEIGAPDGPLVVMLHGAGGATHSWRDLIPLLQDHVRMVALDLPGHGFTRSPASRAGLNAMAQDVAGLCRDQGWAPQALIAHSAGAAVALRLTQILPDRPRVLAINPALAPFEGVAGWAFPMMARLLALNPLTSRLFTMGSSQIRQAERLISGTGSRLSPEGIALYARLMGDRAHVNGTLQMMARWDLNPLLAALPDLPAQCHFLLGENDRAVATKVGETAAARMPDAKVTHLTGLGHLAHEEDPERVAHHCLAFLSPNRS